MESICELCSFSQSGDDYTIMFKMNMNGCQVMAMVRQGMDKIQFHRMRRETRCG